MQPTDLIAEYEGLTASEVVAVLPTLGADELRCIDDLERSGRNRVTILRRIAALQVAPNSRSSRLRTSPAAEADVTANSSPDPAWRPTPAAVLEEPSDGDERILRVPLSPPEQAPVSTALPEPIVKPRAPTFSEKAKKNFSDNPGNLGLSDHAKRMLIAAIIVVVGTIIAISVVSHQQSVVAHKWACDIVNSHQVSTASCP